MSITELQVLSQIYTPASNNFICLLFALSQGQNLKVLCINLVFLLNFSKFYYPYIHEASKRLLNAPLTVVSYDFLLL